jgi:hypothetical protein
LKGPWQISVRYHAWQPDGRRQRTLTRKTVLADLADLTTWLGQPDWRGHPIYLMAEPVAGLLEQWRRKL